MAYYIFPQGSPSHTSPLEARVDTASAFPFLPIDPPLQIEWWKDGSMIPGKSGYTDDLSLQKINTGDPSDYNFDASDTGSYISFLINGITFSNAVVLSNQTPTLTASVVTDGYNRVPGRPTINWVFSDPDGDPQFFYRVQIGTTPGAGNTYDTGLVYSTAQTFTLPSTESELTDGALYYWTVETTDGEKVTPPTSTDRVLTTASGSMIINTPPTVSDVRINGVFGGASVSSFKPTISWTYADVDGQPQQSFRIRVSENADLTGAIWDSGVFSGSQQQALFNFNLTATAGLESHVLYYVGVNVYDTLESSTTVIESFTIAHNPTIIAAFVDDKINPTNLKNTRPTFTWQVDDPDGDPITGYEIRVSEIDTDLGTDSFVGNIWNTGPRTTPEAFEAVLGTDTGAFPGCVFPKELQPNVMYYFQIRVYKNPCSAWFTGFFRLNNAPSATGLAIIPASPYTSDDLEAYWEFVDDEGEAESDLTEIRWYRDGTEQASLRDERVIPSDQTSPFQTWYFTVRPHDGVEYGSTYTSPSVVIANRPPVASSLAINPTQPKTRDALEAVFVISDPDGDNVTSRIRWFKDGIEQSGLRNQRVVPPFLTNVGEEWYFTVEPTDGYTPGTTATSPTVEIANTKPEILSVAVNDQVMPTQLDDANPTISWSYLDADSHAQQAYQVVVGTKPFRTKARNASLPTSFCCGENSTGIISAAAAGEIVSGNEVYDSGIVTSPNAFFQYLTDDYAPDITVGAPDAFDLVNYRQDPDLKTMRLALGASSGSVSFRFPGLTGTYDTEIVVSDEAGKPSSYELLVDGVSVSTVASQGNDGVFSFKFKVVRISSGSRVSVRGRRSSEDGDAAFTTLSFSPVLEFKNDADEFDALSGYVSDGTGGIRLVGLAGTAVLDFPHPSGTYNIELVYQTESSGNPTMSVSVNNSVVDSFSFESGVKTRSRFIRDIDLVTGDTFKISGSRSGAASARVKYVVFRPIQTVQSGTELREGIRYYVSVRAFDGMDWSDWASTRFSINGSAWVSSVSNSKGWTIEARFAVTSAEAPATTTTTVATTTETTAATSEQSVLSTIIDALQTAQAAQEVQQTQPEAPHASCQNDSFQGIRFYDGTAFGWLRLQPDKVELLVDEPLEVELDGTEMHTYRITVSGKNIKLYVDNVLTINGTSRFTQPTSKKLLEFGDIAGRQQAIGSEWESFRYSIDGAYAPNALVDYALDEVQRFADASVGRLKTYSDSLYASVDPNDPQKSSKLYRFDEGFEPEPRSVVALTRSTISSVVVDTLRNGNLFDTSGKFMGTHRGLQYLMGSKPFPFDQTTRMYAYPEENGDWELDSTCAMNCRSLYSGILTIDTTGEAGEKYHRYTQRLPDALWVEKADNEKGWTVEARVKIGTDGAGDGLDRNSVFVLSSVDTCDPAKGINSNLQTLEPPVDDGLNSPGIFLNDGSFQEVVQFFSSGIRLKYARLFAEQPLNDQFYTIRVIGKGSSIAVYAKGDNDRFFKQLIHAPDGLFVPSQPVGDQELPQVVVDDLGIMNVVYQDSREGQWGVYFTKSLPKEIVARGTAMYSSSFADFEKFVKARPGFGLPADQSNQIFGSQSLFSGGASFRSWGVQAGDFVLVFSPSKGYVARKLEITSVPTETVIIVDTDEDLSEEYDGAEYIILRGEERWLPPMRVSAEMLDSNNPRMAITGNTEAFVAYQNSEHGSTEIYVRRGLFDPFYMNWRQSARITNSRFDSSNPDIAIMEDGTVVVVWQDSRNDRNGSQIFASDFSREDFGVLEAYPNRNLTPDSKLARNPRVVAIGAKAFVAYEDDPDEDGNYDIFVVELGPGTTVGDPVQVSTGNGDSRRPSIAVGQTDVYVAYDDDRLGAREIYVAKVANVATVASYGSPTRLTDSRGESECPDIKVDGSGNVWAVFQDDKIRSGNPELYAAKYDVLLGEWIGSAQRGLDIKIETYVTSSSHPSLCMDTFGNPGIVWEASKEGELKKLARIALDGAITMDTTVQAYFPLDDNGTDSVVQNKFRKNVGSVVPPVEVVVLGNRSGAMDSGDKILDVKSVVASLVSALESTDSFNSIFFNESTTAFSANLSEASTANMTANDAFVNAIVASGEANLSQALSAALAQGFTAGNATTKVIVLVGDGLPTRGTLDQAGIVSAFVGANSLGVKIYAFGVSGANRSMYSALAEASGGSTTFLDDFADLSEAFTDFYEKFQDNRDSARRFEFAYEEQQNGTAFDNTDLYHVSAPDSGVSLRNPTTQGAFDLNENGKGFSIPASLLNPTGAIDAWFKPHWVSTDITERVIFGNAPLDTVIPHTISFGVRPAALGSDLVLRVVDEIGGIRETYVNNGIGGINRFNWNIDELVHLRIIWDQNAVGIAGLRSVVFPTSSVGYATSEAGVIWKTTDGGDSWTAQRTNVTYELYSLDFIDASIGWACGEFGTVLKTVDGGSTWSTIDTGFENDLTGIYFRTSLIGYAVGSSGLILRTTNGGTTWSEATVSATGDFRGVGLARSGASAAVIAIGANGQIYRSTNDGASYSQVNSLPVTAEWQSVSRTHQAGTYSTYVVGSAGSIMKTTDMGASWTNLTFDWTIGYRPNLKSVSHGPNSNYVYVVGQNGMLARSTDGSSFSSVETGVHDGTYWGIEANFGGSGDNQTIVAVGVGGTVMISTSAGTVQRYSVTRCGNLTIFINGIEAEQIRTSDGPFQWNPSSISAGLTFGDCEANGTRTANAVFDEVVVYSAPPPNGALFRRKEMSIIQTEIPTLLITEGQEKRIEWGDISPLVATKSYWTDFKMFLCGAKEPLQVFAWDSQLGLVDDVIRDMAMDKSGRLWIATENGISAFDTNSANEDIEKWMSGRALTSGPKDRFVNYTNIVDDLLADSVTCIAVDDNNNVWAGTDRGLMLLENQTETFSQSNEDPLDTSFGQGEVVNAPVQQFRHITVDDGLPSNRILSIAALDGAVFVGTDQGLVVVRTEEQVVSGTQSTEVTSEIEVTAEGTTSTETSATQTAQQTQLDVSNISVFTTNDGLPSNRIQAIAQERRNGDIWIGTDKGLVRFFPDGSISYDTTSGLINSDIFSITIDDSDRKYVGTGFGITRIDGTDMTSFQPSEVGVGAIVDGDEDATGVKWFATSTGLLEMKESCSQAMFARYDLDDGILGQPGVTDFERYIILGGDIPHGGCNKALVNVAVNGEQLSGGFRVDEFFPWVIFDRPRAPSDKVEVCVHEGWREAHDFGFDPRNPDGQAFVQSGLSRLLLYRKRYPTGDVLLGANFAQGAANTSTAMYTVFAKPIQDGASGPVSSISSPSGAELGTAAKGTSLYSDVEDDITLIAAEIVGAQHIALPSADSSLIDDTYLEFSLESDAFVYVAYDSRSTSLPAWLREFEPMPAVFRVTDLDTFVDATGKDKLFASVEGTAGCVFDVLKDPEICDISDQIAVDQEPPDGCATIVRLNSSDEAVLSLTATDAVTGVADMQVSAYENFTTDGTVPVGWVSFQPTYSLELPVEATDPIVGIEDSAPPDDNTYDVEQHPDIEYTIAYEHLGIIHLGSKDPGRVFSYSNSTQTVTFLFDTGEDEVLSMVSFGSDLIVGTGPNGRAFRWNGQVLTQIILPDPDDQITSLEAFDNRVFFGTSPNGKIFEMDQYGSVQLFRDTEETSVNGFAIYGGQLYWATSNYKIREGDILTLTTRRGHRHNITVPAGTTEISSLDGTTTEVDGHVHVVIDGVVQVADGHDHQVNGSRSGKVFKLDLVTDLVTIVHSDRDYAIEQIVSTSMEQQALMFVGTFPNGKILRFVPEEGFFIKSFDTKSDRITRLRAIDSIVYAVADDDMFYFDGRRWQFFGAAADQITDIFQIGDDILVVRPKSLGTITQVQSDGSVAPREICAYVRFRDFAGNVSTVRDDDGNFVVCYRPCITSGGTGGDGTDGGGTDGGTDGSGDGGVVNPLLAGAHRIVEVNEDARTVFRINGPEPFLSGNRVEEEVGLYYSEVFNGTNSLVQWTSLSWDATTPSGTSITIAVRSANTSSEIAQAEFGAEFTDPTSNDLTNLTGQFLQFRATLRVSQVATPSPELERVVIQLRTSQATHYYTTNFVLPDELRRGILTYNGCINPPATDVVFGISGKDSVDFSDYFVITPNKVFEAPSDHQTTDLRVGIKFISSPDQVPVVDEFALLFSLANDAYIRLNLAGQPGGTDGPPLVTGNTRTVVTEKVQGHTHTITYDATITDQFGINGQTSINAGHNHAVVNGVVQMASGHQHDFDISG